MHNKILLGAWTLLTAVTLLFGAGGGPYPPPSGGGGGGGPGASGASGLTPPLVSSIMQPGGIVVVGDSLGVQFTINDSRFPTGFQTGYVTYGGTVNAISSGMGYYQNGITILGTALSQTNESWAVDLGNLIKTWTGFTIPIDNSLCISGGPFYNFGDPDMSGCLFEGYQSWPIANGGVYAASGSNQVYFTAGMTNRIIFWGTNDYGTTNDYYIYYNGTVYNNPSPGNTSTQLVYIAGAPGANAGAWEVGKPGGLTSVRNYIYRMYGNWGAMGSGRQWYPPYYQNTLANDPLIYLTNVSPKMTGVPKALLLFGSQNDRFMLGMRLGTNNSPPFNATVNTAASPVFATYYANMAAIGRSLGYWPIIGASIPKSPTVNTTFLHAQMDTLNAALATPVVQSSLDAYYDWLSSNAVYQANGSYYIDGTHPTAQLARIEATNFALQFKVNQSMVIPSQQYSGLIDNSRQYTTSPLGVLNSPDWDANGTLGMAYNSNNGEYILNLPQSAGSANYQFAVPDGATNVIISFYARVESGTASLLYGIDNNGAWNPQLTANLTTTPQYFTTSNTVLFSTVSTNVGFAMYFNSNVRYYISNLTASYIPVPNDPVLSQPYKHYTVFPRNVWGDVGVLWHENDKTYSGAYGYLSALRGSGQSYVEFITDAAQMSIELFTRGNGYLGSSPPFNNTITVNGILLTNIAVGDQFAQKLFQVRNIQLGSGQNKIVRIYNTFVGRDNTANTVRGIYVPSTNIVAFTRNEANRKVLVIGDSISLNSVFSTDISQNTWGIINSFLPISVYNISSGGQSVSNIISDPLKSSLLYSAAAELNPSDIYIALGINDSGLYNDTNYFAGVYATLIDTLHAQCPRATIYAQNIMYVPSPSATIAPYRLAQQGVCAPRTNYVVFLDASAWLVASDIQGDNIHPTQLGSAKYAYQIAMQLWTNRIVVKQATFTSPQGLLWPHVTNGLCTWTTTPNP